MLKYTTAQVTFREIPDEITLCINISGCPIRCPDCHSKELWEDIGTELTIEELNKLLEANKGISCVCFMGGDKDYIHLNELCSFVIMYELCTGTHLKTALYSGRESLQRLHKLIGRSLFLFDYVKVGPYIKEKGGLDNPNTNQRLYQCLSKPDKEEPLYSKSYFKDITNKMYTKQNA